MEFAQDPTTTGDAVDDLTDIVHDLSDVAWCWDHTGPDEAIWRFRFGFQTHWGQHLFNLRSYIHAALYENLDATEGLI